MQITLDIPDDIASALQAGGGDPSRLVLETVAVEAYRRQAITGDQLRRILGFRTRYEMDGFLKQHEVWLEYSIEDFERDRRTAEQLWRERQAEASGEAGRDRRAG
jgi:hypothetical protein